jgi:hypothetical protein
MNFMILKIWIKKKYGYILSEDIHIETLRNFLISNLQAKKKDMKNKKWIKYKKNYIIKNEFK